MKFNKFELAMVCEELDKHTTNVINTHEHNAECLSDLIAEFAADSDKAIHFSLYGASDLQPEMIVIGDYSNEQHARYMLSALSGVTEIPELPMQGLIKVRVKVDPDPIATVRNQLVDCVSELLAVSNSLEEQIEAGNHPDAHASVAYLAMELLKQPHAKNLKYDSGGEIELVLNLLPFANVLESIFEQGSKENDGLPGVVYYELFYDFALHYLNTHSEIDEFEKRARVSFNNWIEANQ